MAASVVPVSSFRGVDLVPFRGRYEIRLPGQNFPEQYDRIDEVSQASISKGTEWFLNQLLEHVKQVRWEACDNMREFTSDWDLILDQKEGLLPEKGEGMICNTGHNVMPGIYASLGATIEEMVFDNGFFKHEPPGDDRTELGRQISDATERIAKAQLDEDFDRNKTAYIDCKNTFGYSFATTEYEKRFVPKLTNGEYHEEIEDRGTVLRNIIPYRVGFRHWNQPDWQQQGAVIIEHELTIPMILSEHLAAFVNEPEFNEEGNITGDVVYASGSYFNLGKLWEKIKNISTYAVSVLPHDSDKTRGSSDNVDTGIKRVLAFTVWTQDLDMPRLFREAINRGGSAQEIFLMTGIVPDQVEYCKRWKLTAVDSTGGLAYGSDPDILIQARANPYDHGKFPFIAGPCIPFLDRTVGISYGKSFYSLQFALNTLFTLNVDNAIRNSVDMFIVRKAAIAGLTGGERLKLDQNMIYEWNPHEAHTDDASKIVQRIGPGANIRASWPEAASMMNDLYQIIQNESGVGRISSSGRKTAAEIIEIVKRNKQSLTTKPASETRNEFFRFAEQQASNNAQFMEKETALRLAGRAGLNLEFVHSTQEQFGGPLPGVYPVVVKVVGRDRILDRVTMGQMMLERENSPAFRLFWQLALSGQPIPPFLRNWVEDSLSNVGIQDPGRYLPRDDRLTTDQVIKLLRNGNPVDVDVSRFSSPEEMIRELGQVRTLAEEGSVLAEYYYQVLNKRFMEMVMQMKMAGMGGQLGAAGRGQQPGMPGGGISQGPRYLPDGAMTEVGAMMKNAVPTSPNVV